MSKKGCIDGVGWLQVCDQPHPLLVAAIVQHCARSRLDEAYKGMKVCSSWRS